MTDGKRLTGAELLCVRERMGLSQRQLAGILKVSQAALAHWEKETYPIPDWAVDHFIVVCEEWEGRVTAWTRQAGDTITIPRESDSGSADAQAKEDFWAKSERALLTALLSYEYFSADHPRFIAVSDFILQMQAAERGEKQEKSPMDRDMESMRTLVDTVRNNADSADAETLKAIDGLDFALRQYSTYLKGAGETKKSIIISVAVRTAPLQINTVQALLTDIDANKEKEYGQEDTEWVERHHNLHLDTVGDRPTVLFLNLPDTDTSFNFIAAIFYQMLFTALSVHADHLPKKHLDYPVHMLLDEFANIGRIPNFERLIAVIRKRWISVSVIIQNLAQLKTAYKDSWETIAGNCDSETFGPCPICGKPVIKTHSGYWKCSDNRSLKGMDGKWTPAPGACRYGIWKKTIGNNRKRLTDSLVRKALNNEKPVVKAAFHSNRTGKDYDLILVPDQKWGIDGQFLKR